MASSEYIIRTMKEKDVDTIIKWAAAEGWNPGNSDSSCFFNTDPNGFFIGELNGEAIGCISAVAYDDKFGFMGFYIVKEEFRGKGYGIKLFEKAVEYLGDRCIGLDGVVEQQDNYRLSGFEYAYRNIRFEGIVKKTTKSPSYIKNISDVPFKDIIEYDRPNFPVVRSNFLELWLNQSGIKALCIYENEQIKGYGVIRPCKEGYKIGPLFADNSKFAKDILNSLVSNLKMGTPYYFDVPEVNKEAVLIATAFDMTKVFETARMYKNSTPSLSIDKIFGITTFELG